MSMGSRSLDTHALINSTRKRLLPTTSSPAPIMATMSESLVITPNSSTMDSSGGYHGHSKSSSRKLFELDNNGHSGSGSYLPPEALSPWSDIITKYLNGTAPSQKRYWRSKSHRRREHRSKEKSSPSSGSSHSHGHHSRSNHGSSSSYSSACPPVSSGGSASSSAAMNTMAGNLPGGGGSPHSHQNRAIKHMVTYQSGQTLAHPIQNHHHYHQSNQLQQPVVYSPTPLLAPQSHMAPGGWMGQHTHHHIGGVLGYQTNYQMQQTEYQNRLLIEAGEVQRRYSCLKSSGGSSAGSTGSQQGIKASVGGGKSENNGNFKGEHANSPHNNASKTNISSPLADITHVSSPSSNGQNSPMPSGSANHHSHPTQLQHGQHQDQSLKGGQMLEMRPPSAIGQVRGGGGAGAGVGVAEDVTSPLSCHSPLTVNSSTSGNYFSLPVIKDEDLASVGSAASNHGGVLDGSGLGNGGAEGDRERGSGHGGLEEGDSKLVDSIEYESILEAEENYKELVEREWRQSGGGQTTSLFGTSSHLLSGMSTSGSGPNINGGLLNGAPEELLGCPPGTSKGEGGNNQGSAGRAGGHTHSHFSHDDELQDIIGN